jgi:radical SAM protein with 4Fe4S-binding SPASM domain
LDANISRIEISLDAASPETYKSIRGFDKLKEVEANIFKLIEMRNSKKQKKGGGLPLIRLCFVVQDLNRSEVEIFQAKWVDLVDYISFQQLQDVSRVTSYQGKDLQFWLEEESKESRKTETKKLMDYLEIHDPKGQGAFCSYPFNSLNVWSNGDITPCCCFFGKALKIENVANMTLDEAWHSKSLKNLRDQFSNNELNRVCRDCLTRSGEHRV